MDNRFRELWDQNHFQASRRDPAPEAQFIDSEWEDFCRLLKRFMWKLLALVAIAVYCILSAGYYHDPLFTFLKGLT